MQGAGMRVVLLPAGNQGHIRHRERYSTAVANLLKETQALVEESSRTFIVPLAVCSVCQTAQRRGDAAPIVNLALQGKRLAEQVTGHRILGSAVGDVPGSAQGLDSQTDIRIRPDL